MTVFALMTGMYETYDLDSLYSTREAAENAGRIHQGDRNGDWDSAWEIREVEIDENVGTIASSNQFLVG